MYNTWHIYGYGVCVDELEFSLEKLKSLISQAPKFEKELRKYFKKQKIHNPTKEDYLEYDDSSSGIAYILQRIINEAENIKLSIADDINDSWFLLLCPSLPWYNISKEESNLTEETAEFIINKYVSKLSGTTLKCNYCSVENGG